MSDYKEGIKRDVAEIKFLIHDLRVERFINEVIHYHVTLDTDLEIYSVDQAQALHGEDLQELKAQAVALRKALQDYSLVVKSFSPDLSILRQGKDYIRSTQSICTLILNPLWGRIDKVLSFLPDEARAVRSRNNYRNSVRWIAEVYGRIEHFQAEQEGRDTHEKFDIATEVESFVRNVIRGYVTEKSAGRVEIQMDQLDPAVIEGNKYRFRRMLFNLVMNSVDAMSHRKVGLLTISSAIEDSQVVLSVSDTGSGMTPKKISQLMTDKKTLDGELHSLGFVFVRQTVAQFDGTITISSEVGRKTTVAVSIRHLADEDPAAHAIPYKDEFLRLREVDRVPTGGPRGRGIMRALRRTEASSSTATEETRYGEAIIDAFRASRASFPGCIFAMAVTEEGRVEFFAHRPYDQHFNISHEDLSPMLFEATARGRLEEDEEQVVVLILKAPQNVRDYFDFKEIPDQERSPDKYVSMVRDEFIRIARVLQDTGLPPDTGVLLSNLGKFFGNSPELLEQEPFSLESLCRQETGSV